MSTDAEQVKSAMVPFQRVSSNVLAGFDNTNHGHSGRDNGEVTPNNGLSQRSLTMCSLVLDTDAVPESLRELDQWVCWTERDRDGKPTKIPLDPETKEFASTADSETWASFETAVEAIDDSSIDGLGFVFTAEESFVGVDLDDCRNTDNGSPSDVAADIITRLDSYTEVSPSGTGYHILTQGTLPDSGTRSGSVEMYDSGRFFTVTGHHCSETPTTVNAREEALTAVHTEYIQDTATTESNRTRSRSTTPSSILNEISDDELLECATAAANGDKFERLWRGETSGYDSQSEADMALCCLLAFWTGCDPQRIDRLFRRSGLMRSKWDEVHYRDESTYGEKTVERAIAQTDSVYEPSQPAHERAAQIQSPQTGGEQTRSESSNDSTGQPTQVSSEIEKRLSATETTIERLESTVARLQDENEVLREQLETERRKRKALKQQIEQHETGILGRVTSLLS